MQADGNTYFSIVEEYDPATDTWVKKNDIPTGRLWATANTVNQKVYVIGGTQNWTAGGVPTLRTVEEFTDDFVSTGVEPVNSLPAKWGEVKAGLLNQLDYPAL